MPDLSVGPAEDHWRECRYCREVGMCPDAEPIVLHAKTYGDRREWAWACKIMAAARTPHPTTPSGSSCSARSTEEPTQ